MSQNLTNQYIVDTYDGLLHSETTLPNTGVTPMYDGMGNRSSISLGKFGQGAVVHNTLSATTIDTTTTVTDNLTVGQLSYPKNSTVAGRVMVAANANTLALSTFSQIMPDSGVLSGDYTLGDLRNITVNNSGLITGMKNSEWPWVLKDMGRIRVVTSPSNWIVRDFEIPRNEWTPLKFDIGVGAAPFTDGATPKAAILYIERSDHDDNNILNPGESASDSTGRRTVKLRSSRNPIGPEFNCENCENGGDDNNVLYDGSGHHVLRADSGKLVGTQFFTTLSANDALEAVVYFKEEGTAKSYWDISLQAVYY